MPTNGGIHVYTARKFDGGCMVGRCDYNGTIHQVHVVGSNVTTEIRVCTHHLEVLVNVGQQALARVQ